MITVFSPTPGRSLKFGRKSDISERPINTYFLRVQDFNFFHGSFVSDSIRYFPSIKTYIIFLNVLLNTRGNKYGSVEVTCRYKQVNVQVG